MRSVQIPSLADSKEILAAIQSGATIVALVAGGWWFITKNQAAPRLKVEHAIAAHGIDLKSGELLVSVEIKATNTGNTPISVPEGELRIIRMGSGAKILSKDTTEERTLQSGESDQIYVKTYLVPPDWKTIQIESHVPYHDGSEWQTISLFDVKTDSRSYSVTESAGK